MVAVRHGVLIGRFHAVCAGNGANQHKQCGFRQVKVSDNIINNFEFIARRNKYAGFSGKRAENAVLIPGGFKQAERSRADGDNSFARGFGLIDGVAGFLADNAVFGMHFVVVRIFNFDRKKSSGADVQR